jgi:hypothetical protein
MTQACEDAREPIAIRIARMKQSVARLEALQSYFPDLTLKQDPMKDIYQSKEIWRHVEDLEILNGSNVIKVLPFKDVEIVFHDDNKSYKSEYRIYTNPMEICIVGYYDDYEGNVGKGLNDRMTIIQIQNYMEKLGTNLYSDSLLKKIEYQLYAYLKRTILTEPKRYRIENDQNLPEKLQTLITFA